MLKFSSKLFPTIVLFSIPIFSQADVMTDDIPVCTKLMYLEQANEAKKRNDARGMGYLIEKGHCFYAKAGTEYSVIDVNYPEDPSEWVKIRVYTSEGTAEIYSWYGFVM